MSSSPLLCALALSLAFGLSSPAAAQDEDWEARLTSFSGEVYVRSAGAEEWRPAGADLPLESGDEIQTGPEGSAEITLEGENVVDLGSSSQLQIVALPKAASTWELALGTLFAKLASWRDRRQFHIRTPTAVAAVRGTEFGVEVREGATDVGVFDEGRVAVRLLEGEGEALLEPGSEVSASPGLALKPRRLERFLKRRARMQKLRTRLTAVRKAWRSHAPGKRRELRGNFMKQKALRGEEFKRKRRSWSERRGRRPEKRGREVRQKLQEKKEERRRKLKPKERRRGRRP